MFGEKSGLPFYYRKLAGNIPDVKTMRQLIKDPIKALELYRTRDVVEKAFGNLKERLNCRRMLTSSDLALEGKLFVEFVALIYLSYIKGKMQEKGLFANCTMRELLDELDVIECYEAPGSALTVGEVLKKAGTVVYRIRSHTASRESIVM